MNIRNIGSKEEQEKKKKRRIKILTIGMLILLALSSAGFAFLSNPGSNSAQNAQNKNNNGVQDLGGRWGLNYGGQNLVFSNSPESVKEVNVETGLTANNFYGGDLYIDSQNPGIVNEIASTIGRFSNRWQEACYGKCDRNLPEKNCTDSMIIFKESQDKRVYEQDKCVFIEGDMSSVDAFLYKLFGKI